MDDMELNLRKSAAFKMRVTAGFILLLGVVLLIAGLAGDMIKPVILGAVVSFLSIIQFARANQHLRGEGDA